MKATTAQPKKPFTILIIDPHVPYRVMLNDLVQRNKNDKLKALQDTSNMVQLYATHLPDVSIIRVSKVYSTYGINIIEKIKASNPDASALAMYRSFCEEKLQQLGTNTYYIFSEPATEILDIVKDVCKPKRVIN